MLLQENPKQSVSSFFIWEQYVHLQLSLPITYYSSLQINQQYTIYMWDTVPNCSR